MKNSFIALCDRVCMCVCVGGEQPDMDKAMTILEPVAKEYIEKWKKDGQEQVKK